MCDYDGVGVCGCVCVCDFSLTFLSIYSVSLYACRLFTCMNGEYSGTSE